MVYHPLLDVTLLNAGLQLFTSKLREVNEESRKNRRTDDNLNTHLDPNLIKIRWNLKLLNQERAKKGLEPFQTQEEAIRDLNSDPKSKLKFEVLPDSQESKTLAA